MIKRCSILQTKLNELESKIHAALLLHDDEDKHEELSEDIKQRFVFIKSLLSAEISSSPPASSTPHHLQYVAGKIHILEDAFLKWHSSKDFSAAAEEFAVASHCSCTESCFNDDGGEAGGELSVAEFAEPEEFPDEGCKAMVEWKEAEECFDGEKEEAMVKWEEGNEEERTQKLGSLVVYEDARDHFLGVEGLDHGGLVIKKEFGEFGVILKSTDRRKKEGPIRRKKNSKTSSGCEHGCCAMACGAVFGMVFSGFIMMLGFLACIDPVDESYSLIPT